MKQKMMLVFAAILFAGTTVLAGNTQLAQDPQQDFAIKQRMAQTEMEMQSRTPVAPDGSFGRFKVNPVFGAWWKDSQIAGELGLSASQVRQIEEQYLNFRLALIDAKANVERQETLLHSLLESDQPDETSVGTQIDKLVQARGNLEKANIMMTLGIRRVLTPQQWRQLEDIKSREMHHRMRMAPPAPGLMQRSPKPPSGAPGDAPPPAPRDLPDID